MCITSTKKWIDAAAVIDSPSVRTNIPPAKDSKPDVERAAKSLKLVAEYAATKNIVVNLENDNPASEDPFFLVKVIEQVNSPWLHALPDFANTLAAFEEEYAYKGIDAMFGKAYNISHVKETEVGDGKEKSRTWICPELLLSPKNTVTKATFRWNGTVPGILTKEPRDSLRKH